MILEQNIRYQRIIRIESCFECPYSTTIHNLAKPVKINYDGGWVCQKTIDENECLSSIDARIPDDVMDGMRIWYGCPLDRLKITETVEGKA